MIHLRDRRFLAVGTVVAALVVFVLPGFLAFRYTAPGQRGQYITRPWRGWRFAYAALAVPGDSVLKTSGMALRKADWIYRGTVIDPREVQLLFVSSGRPYTFTQSVDGRTLTTSVVSSYRFIWQVQGEVATLTDGGGIVVALLDYRSGRLLYDVRDDLTAGEISPVPDATASPDPAP